MKTIPIRWLLPGLLLVLGAVGCGGAAAGTAPASEPAAESAGPGGLSAAEVEALYRARTDSARMRFTEADVRFMNHMIAHHAQALVMAALAPTHGASDQVRTLAARIDNAQRDEIRTMQRWLEDRGQPVPEVHVRDGRMMVHGVAGDAHHGMPGMLSEAQLAQLDRARGAEFDRLFLESMIQHHRGAVAMVLELFATDGAGQDEEVFRFASDVQVDQRTEVQRMELMLDALAEARETPGRRDP